MTLEESAPRGNPKPEAAKSDYRSAQQNRHNEYFLLAAKGGTYGDLEEAQALRLYVDRAQEIIKKELTCQSKYF